MDGFLYFIYSGAKKSLYVLGRGLINQAPTNWKLFFEHV